MIIASPLESPSDWLNGSNIVYLSGAALTVAGALYLLFNKVASQTPKYQWRGFWVERVGAVAALLSLVGAIGAIHYGGVINTVRQAAIAQSQTEARFATLEALKARVRAEEVAQDNLILQEHLSEDVRERDSRRIILNPRQAATLLKEFRDVRVIVQSDDLDQEEKELSRQLMNIFTAAGVMADAESASAISGNAPINAPGVHLLHDDNPRAVKFSEALAGALSGSEIKTDQGPPGDSEVLPGLSKPEVDQLLSTGKAVVWVHVGRLK